ncbi:MAG: shikimate dehydrogenase [Alphaproteobacteria bacterium]
MISGKARLAGVIGWPVGHSRSPRLHGWWLDHYRIDGAYVPLPVKRDHVAAVLRALGQAGFRGVNVTVPHKEAALKAVDEATPIARRVGAVNTIFYDENGRMVGDNTDGFGFLENLRETRPDWRAEAGPAVVLGAGGAARAVCAALLDAGAPSIRLVNRTIGKADALSRDIGGTITPVPWAERARALEGAALLVNTTTLGMAGADPLDIDLATLPTAALVTDIVYAPLETPLLKAAAARGNPVVDGIGMLLHQARPGFAGWFGVEPEVTVDLRAFVLSE